MTVGRSILGAGMLLLSASVWAEGSCGTLSTFFDGPEVKDIFAARIGVVDGKNQLLEKREHRLVPGPHEVKVYEMIDAPELAVDKRHRGYGKVLKIEVEANKSYYVGAKFVSQKRFDRNDFWEPVVWQVNDSPCTPP